MSWARLRVPASSANLGPGFDALGLALDIYLECRFRPSEQLKVRVSGCDAQAIPKDATNLIWRTALLVASECQAQLPAIELDIHNHIPLGKGLGSSAAALTAGVVIADHLLGLHWPRTRILDIAARLEGHPDNVAAAVLGGIVVSAMDGQSSVQRHVEAIRLQLPPGCAIAVIVPEFVLPTSESRAVLPWTYSREDVVFNLQRTGLLVAALATGSTHALKTALGDRLHQPYRAALIPGLADVLSWDAPGLFGCVLSGAGPSVLMFFERGREDLCALVSETFQRGCGRAQVLHAGVAADGYELLVEKAAETPQI